MLQRNTASISRILETDVWGALLRLCNPRHGHGAKTPAPGAALSPREEKVSTRSLQEMHLDILDASDAVKEETSKQLPLDLVEGAVFVGRSRDHAVCLLKDGEVSKKHAVIRRDVAGDVWIEVCWTASGAGARHECNSPVVTVSSPLHLPLLLDPCVHLCDSAIASRTLDPRTARR